VRSLLGLFAAVGVLLAVVGIYGVVTYGARQRTREIGIRMALGATPRSVVGLVVREGVAWASLGTAAGIGAALLLSRAMRTLVFGISTTDPLTFAVVPVLLLGVALAASWLPARRAARVCPTEVLRE
jgi:ABC-type antimicrobial peptide transport system permease subunit